MKKTIIPLILVLGIIGVLAVFLMTDLPASAMPIHLDIEDWTESGYGGPCQDLGTVEVPDIVNLYEGIVDDWCSGINWEDIEEPEDLENLIDYGLIPAIEEGSEDLWDILDDMDTSIVFNEPCDTIPVPARLDFDMDIGFFSECTQPEGFTTSPGVYITGPNGEMSYTYQVYWNGNLVWTIHCNLDTYQCGRY